MKRFLFGAALVSLVLVSLVSCAGDVEQTTPTEAPVPVRLHVVSSRQAAVTRTAAGAVFALARTELATRLAGRLLQVSVREGDVVNTGQLLASIDADDLDAALARARAHLEEARAGLDLAAAEAERAEILHAEQALTDQARDRAIAARQQAQAVVTAARRAIEGVEAERTYGFLRAPFDGIIVGRFADEGDLVSPGMPVLVVERTDSVRVVAAIPESDVDALRAGDSVHVECGATMATGIVHSIIATDTGRRTFDVQVLLPADDELRAGRFARLTYQTGSRASLWLPEDAIIREGQLQGAFVVDRGQALLRWLRLGETDRGTVEVFSGLNAGDSVAIGGPGLHDGARVTGG